MVSCFGDFLFKPSITPNKIAQAESTVFLYCRLSLFLKDPFSRLFVVLEKVVHVLQSTDLWNTFLWTGEISSAATFSMFKRCQGWVVQVNLKKALTRFFFIFPNFSLFYRSQMLNFKENYHFSRFQRRVQHFPGGGGNFFHGGGGGSNCLFPKKTHKLVIFQGAGPDPLSPLWIRTCYGPVDLSLYLMCNLSLNVL